MNSRDDLKTESTGSWQLVGCTCGEDKRSPKHLDSGLHFAEAGNEDEIVLLSTRGGTSSIAWVVRWRPDRQNSEFCSTSEETEAGGVYIECGWGAQARV